MRYKKLLFTFPWIYRIGNENVFSAFVAGEFRKIYIYSDYENSGVLCVALRCGRQCNVDFAIGIVRINGFGCSMAQYHIFH